MALTRLILVLLNPDLSFFWKQCRSRSAGFLQSHVIRIHSVFHTEKKMLTAEMLQINRLKIEECSI